ncbi:HalOD1 output domain-containing protein [Natronosalvus rutilus]|uniref:Halobacterial output domain-containing protein n=1 Tax=Natronosalvus rutilus TaxID=2953753 RepID=A0A9E7N8G7_9EURY|nr:HalOD1 output domain-containing protein [Natronosalvus rutilus]UTF53370.1 hypothetical protein NGM29_16615 [Natronosalvus rutilus]
MSHRSPTDRLVRAGGTADRPIYYDDRRGTYHTWYDGGTYEPVTTAVLMGVSTALEADLETLEPLATAIDPEALDDLFTRSVRSRSRARARTNALVVSFEYAECGIRIHESGEIVIDPR